jgi:hypothetical protein
MRRSLAAAALLLLVALALAVIAYLPGLDAGFYFDDRPNIQEAPALQWEELPSGDWLGALAAPRHPARCDAAPSPKAGDPAGCALVREQCWADKRDIPNG